MSKHRPARRLLLWLALVLLAGQAGSCAWIEARWPWRKKEVPVTLPEHSEPWPAGEPAPAPVAVTPVPPPAPAPVQPLAVVPALPEAPPQVLSGPQVVAATVLRVNDRFFSVDDLLEAAASRLASLPRDLPEHTFRQQAAQVLAETVQNLVTEALILEQIDPRLTEEQKETIEKEVQDRLAQMTAEAGGSRVALERKLISEGTSLDRRLEELRREVKVHSYLRGKFGPTVAVTRRMMWEYYRSNEPEFTVAKKVQMQVIAAPVGEFLRKDAVRPTDRELAEARALALETIRQAQQAIQAGEDFTDIAKRLSRGVKAAEGGVWPMMPAGSFRETKVEQAAFALDEGHVSDIVEADTGYYIVRALRVSPGKVIPFEQAQASIEQKLREQEYRKRADAYFEDLYKTAVIRQSDRFLDLALERALAKYWRP